MSTIVQRSLRSFSWTAGAQGVMVIVGFARSVLLARLLNVETFGIYAGATAIGGLLALPATLGLSGAFLHRAPETADEDRAAAVYLTMQTVAAAAWLLVAIVITSLVTTGAQRTALLVIFTTSAFEMLVFPASIVLSRRLQMERIGLLQVVSTISVALITVTMAMLGFELWTLLMSDIVGVILSLGFLYLWRPAWRPWFAFDRRIVRYYLRFGIPYMFSQTVEYGLQRLDDIYVRFMLGTRAMGYYSRAYTFATYPRAILAAPVAAVAGSAFAELADDPGRLSKAFFRTSALLIRISFLFGILLVVLAPVFVTLLLGEKWLPMVPIFRLFAVFTLVDPLRDLLASVFVALGMPRDLLNYRLVQMGVLVAGLFLLGGHWGAEGVAVAVNLMLLTGLVLMFASVRRQLRFSLLRLFLAPALAAITALAAFQALALAGFAAPRLWLHAIVETAVMVGAYAAVLFLLEGNDLRKMAQTVWAQWQRKQETPAAVAAADVPALDTLPE